VKKENTNENKAFVGLGRALHATQELRHEISGRDIFQIRRHSFLSLGPLRSPVLERERGEFVEEGGRQFFDVQNSQKTHKESLILCFIA